MPAPHSGDRSIKGFELIRQEITSLLSSEYDVRFPADKQRAGVSPALPVAAY